MQGFFIIPPFIFKCVLCKFLSFFFSRCLLASRTPCNAYSFYLHLTMCIPIYSHLISFGNFSFFYPFLFLFLSWENAERESLYITATDHERQTRRSFYEWLRSRRSYARDISPVWYFTSFSFFFFFLSTLLFFFISFFIFFFIFIFIQFSSCTPRTFF